MYCTVKCSVDSKPAKKYGKFCGLCPSALLARPTTEPAWAVCDYRTACLTQHLPCNNRLAHSGKSPKCAIFANFFLAHFFVCLRTANCTELEDHSRSRELIFIRNLNETKKATNNNLCTPLEEEVLQQLQTVILNCQESAALN